MVKMEGNLVKKWLLISVLCVAAVAHAQQKTNLTAASANCTSMSCLSISVDPGQGGATFTITANASGNTIQFEASGDGGTTRVALNVTPSNSPTAVTSSTGTGTWQANTAGYTNVYMRISTLVGGSTTVSIVPSNASARAGGGGGGVTCTPTVGGLVPTPPNDTSLFLNGECLWSHATGSYNTVIDATNYGVTSGGEQFDVGFSNTSHTITFPNNDCPTNAPLGAIIFGTTFASTFSGAGSLIIAQGTITGVCNVGSGTLTASAAAGSDCISGAGTLCSITWGTDQTSNLATFATDVISDPNCAVGILPAGVFLVQSGFANDIPANSCAAATGSNFQGPAFTGIGPYWASTTIVPTPNFDTTPGSGNSCDGGVTQTACFFSTPAAIIANFGISGNGNPCTGKTDTFTGVELNGGTIEANAYAYSVLLSNWCTDDANSIGLLTNSASQVSIQNTTISAFGSLPCKNTQHSPNFVYVSVSQCANGTRSTTANTCGLYNVGTGHWESRDSVYGCKTSQSVITILNSANATLNLDGGYLALINTAANDAYLLLNEGTANLSKVFISDVDSSAGTPNYGIYTVSPAKTNLRDTTVDMTYIGAIAFDTLDAGGEIADFGGNLITTVAANKLGAGSLLGGKFVQATGLPSIASGFGTGASVVLGSYWDSFTINVGTSNTGTGVLTLPTAPNGWSCSATDVSTTSTTVSQTKVVPTSTTSVTFQNYTDISGTHAWVDSDILNVQCNPY
jgi:hypothetical protein